jgi:hypothetical protein
LEMSTTTIVILAVSVIVIAAIAWLTWRKQRTKHLRQKFGPEYAHAVRQYGTEEKAENALSARAHRMEKFHARALTHEEHDRFLERWTSVQANFVDDPPGSIQQADSLVNELMGARGYPVGDFDKRAEDISVEHPQVVQNYRAAHAIAERQAQGQAATEDLRQGLVHFRALFDELLEGHLATHEGRQR